MNPILNTTDANNKGKTTTVLSVHPYDWSVEDAYGHDNDHVAIHCWSLERSTPYFLRITDFSTFCHVELPMFVQNHTYQ